MYLLTDTQNVYFLLELGVFRWIYMDSKSLIHVMKRTFLINNHNSKTNIFPWWSNKKHFNLSSVFDWRVNWIQQKYLDLMNGRLGGHWSVESQSWWTLMVAICSMNYNNLSYSLKLDEWQLPFPFAGNTLDTWCRNLTVLETHLAFMDISQPMDQNLHKYIYQNIWKWFPPDGTRYL